MSKILVFISLLLTADLAAAYVIYYPPYSSPYWARPNVYPYTTYYQSPVTRMVNSNVNTCPLQPSYYDPNGNWVPPKRICPSVTPQININVGN